MEICLDDGYNIVLIIIFNRKKFNNKIYVLKLSSI